MTIGAVDEEESENDDGRPEELCEEEKHRQRCEEDMDRVGVGRWFGLARP